MNWIEIHYGPDPQEYKTVWAFSPTRGSFLGFIHYTTDGNPIWECLTNRELDIQDVTHWTSFVRPNDPKP